MRVRRQRFNANGSSSSIQQDWRSWLPADKAEFYSAYRQQLDSVYNMFSVALNEALELRRTGRLGKSGQALYVIPGLCKRLADPLAGLLRALGQHAKHYGTIPNAAPLSPSNFQGARTQRTARMNELLSRVLLTQRSQFLHKIAALEEMVAQLEQDFRVAAEEIGMGTSLQPQADWTTADTAHYDLNTCLRETQILLKSFLVCLPTRELGALQKTIQEQMHASELHRVTVSIIQPRRMAAGGGK